MTNDRHLLDVYYNRTRDLWSVRRRRLVIEHTPSVVLMDCRLHAGESARLRCERTGQRDVHAWVRGRLADGPRPPDAIRIGYRPAQPGFRRRDTDEIVTAASAVWFEPDGTAWAANPIPSPETFS
ncbi:hypothetical protein [Methylobacterium komagatae]